MNILQVDNSIADLPIGLLQSILKFPNRNAGKIGKCLSGEDYYVVNAQLRLTGDETRENIRFNMFMQLAQQREYDYILLTNKTIENAT